MTLKQSIHTLLCVLRGSMYWYQHRNIRTFRFICCTRMLFGLFVAEHISKVYFGITRDVTIVCVRSIADPIIDSVCICTFFFCNSPILAYDLCLGLIQQCFIITFQTSTHISMWDNASYITTKKRSRKLNILYIESNLIQQYVSTKFIKTKQKKSKR